MGGSLALFRMDFFEPESWFFDGSTIGGANFITNGVGPRLNNCYFKNVTLSQRANSWSTQIALCIYDTCTSLVAGVPSSLLINALQGAGCYTIQRTKIRNTVALGGVPAYGIYMAGGLPIYVENSTINGCASDGVFCADGKITLVNVKGATNAGVGAHADGGGQILVDVNTTVTGTGGDLKAGNMAARTWVDFRANPPLKNQFDVPGFTGATADTTTGARIWQP